MYANKIGAPDFAPPAVVSLVSGGNTMLVHMRGWGDYRVLGATIDDAVGEAFDKVAKALGLGYPGGPVVSGAGRQGQSEGHRVSPRHDALRATCIQPFRPEDRRGHLHQQRARSGP